MALDGYKETLESDAFSAELAAAKSLAKIEKKLFAKPSAKTIKPLAKLVKNCADTKVGKRAQRLMEISELALQ